MLSCTLDMKFFVLLLLPLAINAGLVVEVTVKTACNTNGADMDEGGIIMTIVAGGKFCSTGQQLDIPTDQWESCNEDHYGIDDIGDCKLFDVGEGDVTLLLTHAGGDAWKGEYFDLVLTDGTLRCLTTEWLDEFRQYVVTCQKEY